MTNVTIIDGIGNTHTRVYPSVGALPAPNIGAFAIVDGGTHGVLYIAMHTVTGTLAWIQLSDLLNPILVSPPPGHNIITDTDASEYGLAINASGGGIHARAVSISGLFDQSGFTPTDPAILVEREVPTADVPLVETSFDGSAIDVLVNGYGETTVKSYDSLPTITSDHLGAIVRLIGGSGVADKYFMGALNNTGGLTWAEFKGPTGDTGPAGPTGPAGAQGQVNFPDLPASGDSPVTFEMIVLPGGTELPWIIPDGYEIQVLATRGLWSCAASTGDFYAMTGVGSTFENIGSFRLGRIVAQDFTTDVDGKMTLSATFYDAWSLHTIGHNGTVVRFQQNFDAAAFIEGYLVATVQITPTGLWTHTFDFTIDAQGFIHVNFDGTGYDGTYVAATGWQGLAPAIGIQFIGSAGIVHVEVDYAGGGSDVTVVSSYVTNSWSGSPPASDFHNVLTAVSPAVHTINVTNTAAYWFILTLPYTGATRTVTKIVVTGTGFDPF